MTSILLTGLPDDPIGMTNTLGFACAACLCQSMYLKGQTKELMPKTITLIDDQKLYNLPFQQASFHKVSHFWHI